MQPKLLQINPEQLVSISTRSDIRIEEAGENLCCRYSRRIERLLVPEVDIITLNVNYCFVCGKKLR